MARALTSDSYSIDSPPDTFYLLGAVCVFLNLIAMISWFAYILSGLRDYGGVGLTSWESALYILIPGLFGIGIALLGVGLILDSAEGVHRLLFVNW